MAFEEAEALAAAFTAAAEIAKNNNIFMRGEEEREEMSSENENEGNVTGIDMNENNENQEGEEDAEKRLALARSRERNREHARRTRLRKKAQMEALQTKVSQLQEEGRVLKQSVEECSIASILVGLSSGNQHQQTSSLFDVQQKQESTPKLLKSGKRKRFSVHIESSVQPLKLDIEGQTTLIGAGKTHINWKRGVYCDENGLQRQLTQEQLESLRRERNRMHAKMTRDRKKCFISTVEKTILSLENENKRMRHVLATVASMGGAEEHTPKASPPKNVTPMATPQFTPVEPRTLSVTPEPSEQDNVMFSLSTA